MEEREDDAPVRPRSRPVVILPHLSVSLCAVSLGSMFSLQRLQPRVETMSMYLSARVSNSFSSSNLGFSLSSTLLGGKGNTRGSFFYLRPHG